MEGELDWQKVDSGGGVFSAAQSLGLLSTLSSVLAVLASARSVSLTVVGREEALAACWAKLWVVFRRRPAVQSIC